MDNEEIHRRAAERRRKVIANAEARLKRISDLAKTETKSAPQTAQETTESEFVDFEVDSFVNNNRKAPNNEFQQVPNGFGMRNGSGTSNDLTHQEEFARMFQRGQFGSNNFTFSSMSTPNPRQPNGFNMQDLNNSMNAMFSSQQPADLNNLLNALSGLASASGQMPRSQAPPTSTPQEVIQPALKPALSIVVFLILGLVARIFFQFSSLKINVFAPFLCLAVPIAIMSWGRRRPAVTGLLSVAMLFVQNSLTRSLILNWVRLTTLLRGLSQLFACYFFSFVITHLLFELSTIHQDITEHSTGNVQ